MVKAGRTGGRNGRALPQRGRLGPACRRKVEDLKMQDCEVGNEGYVGEGGDGVARQVELLRRKRRAAAAATTASRRGG